MWTWLRSVDQTRFALIAVTYLTAGVMTILFAATLATDGLAVLDGLLIVLFGLLLATISWSFWSATFGLIDALLHRRERWTIDPDVEAAPLAKTAILMPVYNECPNDVFANVEAIRRSVQWTGQSAAFDIFVLSDTTNPDTWIREELAWARSTHRQNDVRVYYRRRQKNVERKAGNIADFCRRWGHAYEQMVVLDADSVMSGETLVTMVRRMMNDDEIGILQAPPRPVGCDSLFARLQQFSAATYSKPFLRGFARWTGDDGNYWGHNAIIRVDAFLNHCGLPKLPGKEPLGGEILSHDFVEAALMRRAGYKVLVADDLDGSYEQCPTGLDQYARRDHRWCQGNLQHARLLSAEGFAWPSRLHLLMGVLSYVSSPLWLLFLVGGILATSSSPGAMIKGNISLGLFVVSMVMLLLPKAYGVGLAIADERQREAQGGAVRILASMCLETIASVLLAPVLMLYHSRFVSSVLSGKRVTWSTASRDDHAVTWPEAARSVWWAPAAGVALAATAALVAPETLVWLSPIIAGLLLAIPFVWASCRPDLGRWLRDRGLLLVREETTPPIVIVNRDKLRDRQLVASDVAEPEGDGLRSLIHNPQLLSLHTEILRTTGCDAPLERNERHELVARMTRHETLSSHERLALQSDASLLTDIHLAIRSGKPLDSLA